MAFDIKPLARAEELVVRDMDDEVLVYDLASDEAITLNLFAGTVWRACDGTRDVAGLMDKLHQDMPGDLVTEAAVWQALDMLSRCDLLQQRVMAPANRDRRTLVKALGIGAVAVPIVAMISVPTAAQAASCACVNPGGCITQTACPSTVNCNPSGVCAP
ncbi:PqqD family peptide modification chaperone [Novosphingobium aquae]|uniref:PqqD family protein n=1 Tax=Novosphingobium aquae TaxID=3133435 RepID=A0ABU8S628_9SPHN